MKYIEMKCCKTKENSRAGTKINASLYIFQQRVVHNLAQIYDIKRQTFQNKIMRLDFGFEYGFLEAIKTRRFTS